MGSEPSNSHPSPVQRPQHGLRLTPPAVEAQPATEEWVKMETLASGKWVAIEGAADLEWDEKNAPFLPLSEPHFSTSWAPTVKTDFLAVAQPELSP